MSAAIRTKYSNTADYAKKEATEIQVIIRYCRRLSIMEFDIKL